MNLLIDAADSCAYMGDYPKAEEYFKKATELEPQSPRAWEFYVAYWSKHRGNTEKARAILDERINTLPPTAGLMREAGTVFADAGDLKKAEEFYRKGLEVERDDHLLLNRLGLLLRRKGQLREAAELLRLATIYSEGHGNQLLYFLELGTTCFALGKHEKALKAFLSAEGMHEGSAASWIRRCRIELAAGSLFAKSSQEDARPGPKQDVSSSDEEEETS